MQSRAVSNGQPIVQLVDLAKSYGPVQALQGVSMDIYPGQVLAIVGDNGAGKSTLIKILSGALKPDQGQIIVEGRSYLALSPAQAIELGISTVYQDLALVDCRDVATNVFLGQEPTVARFLVNSRQMRKRTAQILHDLNIQIPSLTTSVGLLSGGQRQGVAVARAVFQGGKVIIFDEPTAAMGVNESRKVLALIQRLRAEGLAVVVISHNLHHVFAISDRICVMRHGQVVGECRTSVSHPNQIVELITGASMGSVS